MIPFKLELFLTEACNCQCPYCYQGSHPSQKVMSLKTAKSLIEQAIQTEGFLNQVEFFGGEPTLNIPLIREIMNLFPDISYGITTNGNFMNLSEEDRNIIYQCDRIIISTETSYQKECMIRKLDKDTWNRMILELVQFAKSEIRFSFVITKSVVSHMDDFIEMTNLIFYLQEKCKDFKWIHFVIGYNISTVDNFQSVNEWISFIMRIKQISPKLYKKLIRYEYHYVTEMIHEISKEDAHCNFERSITVLTDGRMIPCSVYFQKNEQMNEHYYLETTCDMQKILTSFDRQYSTLTKEQQTILGCKECTVINKQFCYLCQTVVQTLIEENHLDQLRTFCDIIRWNEQERIRNLLEQEEPEGFYPEQFGFHRGDTNE